MDRKSVIKKLYEAAGDMPIVLTTGYTCRDAYALDDRDGNFYMVGSMGHAASIDAGVVLSVDLDVIVVDGDGSLLMNPSGLLLAGTLKLRRLLHIVLDNGMYESTGGQRTGSEDIDFIAIAKASGYKYCHDVKDIEGFKRSADSALCRMDGPSFIRVRIDESNFEAMPRIGISLLELQGRFKAYIESRTNVEIERSETG